jgi:hypothetical protein
LRVGETRTLNATLKVGAVAIEAFVTSAGADLHQVSAEVGGLIQGSIAPGMSAISRTKLRPLIGSSSVWLTMLEHPGPDPFCRAFAGG